ncbi:ABC transporter substrate-binding protein [Nocardiopsis sp. HNM0947]|uniref:ABC transporter substrate-binding protein n=1 Tax=Nocardiopsis coralli TaxID=2772213 RepID=A0ABR9P9A9_9ACTN|nr:ABC transporter substrate-binding protein [Nocardiopsis coralli]MBE3000417.1 ABC transporter substrate-binding protein [Nocardiopsis coralli]
MKTSTRLLGSPGGRPGTRVSAPLAAASALALVAGCSTVTPAEENTSGDTITVTDQRGETLELDGPVERVVTIPMPAASLLVAVDGGTDHLVGMNPSSQQALSEGILGEYYPEAEEIASDISDTDFVPNVESTLELDPDLVIQWGDQGEQLTSPLEDAGIPVLGLDYGTQEDLEEWIEIFGVILGQEERAEQIIATQHEHRETVEAAVANTEDTPSVLYLNQAGDTYAANGTGTYHDFFIDMVGAENAAAELNGTVDVGMEQILEWDPDIVLLSHFDTAVPDDLYSDPMWEDVTAVQDDAVYRIPLGGYRWDPPNQESHLMWHWLAQVVHDDADLGPLRPEIVDTYEFLYGETPTDAQMDEILRTDENSASAGYDVFDR